MYLKSCEYLLCSVCDVKRRFSQRSSAGWDASGLSWPNPPAGDVTSNVTKTFTPAAAVGKRRREVEPPLGDGCPAHTHEMPLPIRARGGGITRGILKAAPSATRIPKLTIDSKPKEAGRGAERLATTSSQGICHQSLPEPCFQQGWAVDAANGTSTWVEGRLGVDGEVGHHIDSTVQQQHEEATKRVLISPEYSTQSTGCSSRLRRATSRLERSWRSSAASAQIQSSRTLKSASGTAGPRRRAHAGNPFLRSLWGLLCAP
jgi:hypothetical protein